MRARQNIDLPGFLFLDAAIIERATQTSAMLFKTRVLYRRCKSAPSSSNGSGAQAS